LPNANLVIFMGTVLDEPELRELTRTQACNFTVQAERHFKDFNGNPRSERVRLTCVAFGWRAERIVRYVKQGDTVHVEGRLAMDEYRDNSGREAERIGLVVEEFQHIPRIAGGSESIQERRAIDRETSHQ
jgi:single-strand DNA-binding protein